MKSKLLIVEDQFIEANNLRIILKKAGYIVCEIARSVSEAIRIIDAEKPDMVLLDIFLDGPQTGIDLAVMLNERNIAFVYLSANSNKETLGAAKATNPYGFLVKPFRDKDVLVMLDVALYRHGQNQLQLAGAGEKREEGAWQGVDGLIKGQSVDGLIKGQSAGLKNVLDQVAVIERSDVSVLILGESGTGKGLIAKAIHQTSMRRMKPLVVVNCAALPANLIESELFGHEKGAFTGANEKRTGKFEQADGGTVFLDEIGELPPDLQVKFLRVLQEREVEPIGGKKRTVDVRVIAATNRNLTDEMASGRFRMDLYYRLYVFPILLPPLRERKEDIPLLAEHFLKLFASKANKMISGFSEDAIKAMVGYSWPGNIRELENIIERSVLLCTGQLISSVAVAGPVEKQQGPEGTSPGRIKTMAENERDHILTALKACNWKIYGEGGAAEMLDMNGNTLYSRMKKLGIEKQISEKK